MYSDAAAFESACQSWTFNITCSPRQKTLPKPCLSCVRACQLEKGFLDKITCA
jgi:hypothetical protein